MDIKKLSNMINESNNIVFFGGAGVSTESNIPDFRSATGLYTTIDNKQFSPEYVLSHSFYRDYTEDFFKFYKENMIYTEAKPNAAHLALAELEKRGKLKAVITQNIDGLHQMAGSKEVLELHGSVHSNYCVKCNKSFNLDFVIESDAVPTCDECNGIVRPDVVLYEEGLDMTLLNRAIDYIKRADIFIVGGTSLRVYPAANLIGYYKGNKLILINKSETSYDNRANLTFNQSIGKVLESII